MKSSKISLRNKLIFSGVLGLSVFAAISAVSIIEKKENNCSSNIKSFKNRSSSVNAVSGSQYDQSEYDDLNKAILAMGFDEGSPLLNLAYLVSDKNPNLSESQNKAEIIEENTNKYRPKLLDFLHKYDNDNPFGWALPLKGYNWRNANLDIFGFFKYFRNITSLEISVDKAPSGQVSSSFDISSLLSVSWIQEIPLLSDVQLSLGVPIAQTPGEGIDIENLHSLDSLEHLSRFNVSGFVYDNGKPVIGGNLLMSSFFSRQNANFEIWMPAKFTFDNKSITSGVVVDSKSEPTAIKFIKKTASEIADPTDSHHSDIRIDSKNISAKYYQSKWFWSLDDVNLLKSVEYKSITDSQEYLTEAGYNAAVDKSNYSPVSVRNDIYDQAMNSAFFDNNLPKVPHSQVITSANIGLINSKFTVDGSEHGYFVVDSTIVPDYDVEKIKFVTKNSQGELIYFTDFDLIPVDLHNGDLSSTFSQVSAQASVKPVQIPNPIDDKDALTFNDKVIHPFLFDGKFEWNLSFQSSSSAPKFYSPSKKMIFSDLKSIASLAQIPNDINVLDNANFGKQDNIRPALKNGYQIDQSNYRDLSNQMIIDNKSVGMTLRNGFIYYDDVDSAVKFSNVRYVHEDTLKKYYTTIDALKKDFPTLKDCYEIAPPAVLKIPPKHNLEQPTFENLTSGSGLIQIENYGQISVTLRQGKLYWDSKDLKNNNATLSISDIKYYDPDMKRYFLEIPANFIPKHITEVNVNSRMDVAVPNETQAVILDPNFNVLEGDNYKYVQNGFIRYDGEQIDYVIHDSKVVFKTQFNSPKFIFDFADQSAEDSSFISSVKKISSGMAPKASQIVRQDTFMTLGTDVNESEFPILSDPTAIGQIIYCQRFDSESNQVSQTSVKTIIKDGKLYWDNPKFLMNMKYLVINNDGSKFYTDKLAKDILSDASSVDSIGKIDVKMFDTQTKITYEYKQTENKKMIAVIASSAGAVVVAIPSFFAWYKWKRGKRG